MMSEYNFLMVPPPHDVTDAATAAEYLEMLAEVSRLATRIKRTSKTSEYTETVVESLEEDVQTGLGCIAVFLRSGSMPKIEDDTVGGFEEFVDVVLDGVLEDAMGYGSTEPVLLAMRVVAHAARQANREAWAHAGRVSA